jgi:hypothetical protein
MPVFETWFMRDSGPANGARVWGGFTGRTVATPLAPPAPIIGHAGKDGAGITAPGAAGAMAVITARIGAFGASTPVPRKAMGKDAAFEVLVKGPLHKGHRAVAVCMGQCQRRLGALMMLLLHAVLRPIDCGQDCTIAA